MDMSRISSSPWGFRLMDLSKFSKFMNGLGITKVCAMFGDPARFPLAISPDIRGVRDAKGVFASCGVSALEVAISVEGYASQIPLAAELGASYVRVCEIWDASPSEFERVSSLLGQAGALAAKHGLVLIVENHGGLMREAEACRALFEKSGCSNVKLNYDPANFLFYGEDPVRAWDALKGFVAFAHLKDVKVEGVRRSYCRIGEGIIDYKSIFARFAKDAYSGPLCLEYEEPSDVFEGTSDDLASLKLLLFG